MPSEATLSVVVIPLIDGPALDACLGALGDVVGPDRAERLVVLSCAEGNSELERWRARHPGVRFLAARHAAVPLRRQQGIEAAKGEIVALIEDTSHPAPGWRGGLSKGAPTVWRLIRRRSRTNPRIWRPRSITCWEFPQTPRCTTSNNGRTGW